MAFFASSPRAISSPPPTFAPARALLHPAWGAAVLLLALNDHVLKGAGVLPGVVTGKLSDIAGLFAAPALLAVLLGVRTRRGVLAAHLATGLVFSAIKLSPAASGMFSGLLSHAGIHWRNWCDPTDLLTLPSLLLSLGLLVPWMQQTTRDPRRALTTSAVALSLPVLLASGEAEGGANANANAPGNGRTGVNLQIGDIAVDPDGAYFLSRSGSTLLVGDLASRSVRSVDNLPTADRVAFWPPSAGRGFFILSTRYTSEDGLVSYDLTQGAELWHALVPEGTRGLVVDKAGQKLVAFSQTTVSVIDIKSGALSGTFTPPNPIRDVTTTPDGARLLVTEETAFEGDHIPSTHVFVRHLADASASCDLVVPNCADELVLAADGRRAFLAPTTCQRDPVSVLDVVTCSLDATLPGFGPVALSPSGTTAVAFLDRDGTDPTAPPLPADVKNSDSRYHLMFLDVATLDYGTLAVGAELPRYTVTPDGKLLLVDSTGSSTSMRILEIADRSLRTVTGPHVLLDDYVLTPDSAAAFAVSQGLFRIDTIAATSAKVGLGFDPTSINIVPSGATLLLKDSDDTVHLWDIDSSRETATIR